MSAAENLLKDCVAEGTCCPVVLGRAKEIRQERKERLRGENMKKEGEGEKRIASGTEKNNSVGKEKADTPSSKRKKRKKNDGEKGGSCNREKRKEKRGMTQKRQVIKNLLPLFLYLTPSLHPTSHPHTTSLFPSSSPRTCPRSDLRRTDSLYP